MEKEGAKAPVKDEIHFQTADYTRVIEEREREIKSIEQSILEVNQIFRDMELLIQQQEGVIGDFEGLMEYAHQNTENGVAELEKAANIQKSAHPFSFFRNLFK